MECSSCIILNGIMMSCFASFVLGMMAGKYLARRIEKPAKMPSGQINGSYKKGRYIKLFGKDIDLW